MALLLIINLDMWVLKCMSANWNSNFWRVSMYVPVPLLALDPPTY